MKIFNQNLTQTLWRYVKLFCILFFLYIYIYNPPLIGLDLSFTKTFWIIILPIFILNQKLYKLYFSFFFKETMLLILIVVYSYYIELLNGTVAYAFSNLSLLIENFIVAFTIIYYLKKSKQDILYIISIVGVIASIISIYLLLNPDINMIVKEEYVKSMDTLLILNYRGFGISENLLFGYAIAQGFIAALFLLNPFSLLNFCLFFLSSFSSCINARIGLVPIVFTFLYCFLKNKDRTKIMSYSLMFFMLIFFLLTHPFAQDIEITINWIMEGLDEIELLLAGKSDETATIDTLTGSMVIIPDNARELIIGTGKSLFGASTGNTSDIGYILMLNYGGIIYILLFFRLFIVMMSELWNNVSKYKILIFVLCFLVCNYKGLMFTTTPGTRLLMLLYFSTLFDIRSLNHFKKITI